MKNDAPVIIVGATGGVGEALARRLAAEGRTLYLVARNADRLAALAGYLAAGHAVADVTDQGALGDAVAAAGPEVSGLAYCVGSIDLKPLRRVTAADMADAFALNAVGAALAVQAAADGLKAANGSVVLFSTVAVGQGFASHAIVASAKGAVEGLTRALAAELAPDVRVNAVAPSLTRTPLAAPLLSNDKIAAGLAKMHALERLGEPDDIAAAAAYLLSPSATWVSGQVIGVDGGRSHLRVRA